MKSLEEFAQNYMEKNNPDPTNFYQGDIQRTLYITCAVIEASLSYASNNTFVIHIKTLRDILNAFMSNNGE